MTATVTDVKQIVNVTGADAQARERLGIVCDEVDVIISAGESNSGGFAPNSSAALWELASRSEVKILNVNTGKFENLDIGTNNNLAHDGLTPATHGWELELANAVRRGEFANPVYYVQTGQGGSRVVVWTTSGGYDAFNTSFLPRINAAKKQLSGVKKINWHIWLTIGINDAIDGLDSYVFKGRLRQLLKMFQDALPGVKIVMTTIPPVNATYTEIATRIAEINDVEGVAVVDVNAPFALSFRDANHWDYQGMKSLANRMIAKTKELSPHLPKALLTWSGTGMTVDNHTISSSAGGQFAHANEVIDFTYDQSIEFQFTSETGGNVIALDTDVDEVLWANTDNFLLGAFINSNVFVATGNGVVVTNFALTGIVNYRFRKIGNDLRLESQDTNGNWTLRHNRTGILNGVNQVRLKMVSAVGAASIRAYRMDAKQGPPLLATREYVDQALEDVDLSAYQPVNSNLTAIAGLTTTSFGRSLLTQADEAATRSTIGAIGSIAPLVISTDLVEQYNGTTAQRSRLFKTRTSATNFEALEFDASGNTASFDIAICSGSAGGSNRSFRIGSKFAGASTLTPWLTIDTSGNVTLPNNGKIIKAGSAGAGSLSFEDTSGVAIFVVNMASYNINSRGGLTSTVDSRGVNWNANTIDLIRGDQIRWRNASFGSFETGISSYSAGVVEINNGTSGTLRDLSLRALTASGNVTLSGLPTTNPGVAGRLWNDGGTLKIS